MIVVCICYSVVQSDRACQFDVCQPLPVPGGHTPGLWCMSKVSFVGRQK